MQAFRERAQGQRREEGQEDQDHGHPEDEHHERRLGGAQRTGVGQGGPLPGQVAQRGFPCIVLPARIRREADRRSTRQCRRAVKARAM